MECFTHYLVQIWKNPCSKSSSGHLLNSTSVLFVFHCPGVDVEWNRIIRSLTTVLT